MDLGNRLTVNSIICYGIAMFNNNKSMTFSFIAMYVSSFSSLLSIHFFLVMN